MLAANAFAMLGRNFIKLAEAQIIGAGNVPCPLLIA